MEGQKERITCPQCHGRKWLDGQRCKVCGGYGEIDVRKSTINVLFDESVMRRVQISCRCGLKSVASIPEPLKRALVIHNCPACNRPFTIQYFDKEGWKVRGGEEPANAVRFFPAQVPSVN